MFENLRDSNLSVGYDPNKSPSFSTNKKIALFGVIILVVLLAAGIIFFKFFKFASHESQGNQNASTSATNTNTNTNSTTPTLPIVINSSSTNPNGDGDSMDGVKAENLYFGNFYKDPREKFTIAAQPLKLPISVKSDVSNYYEFSRKINLTNDQLNELNKNGIVLADNQLKNAENFYAAYQELIRLGVPQLVTSDFLIYYYQNIIKEIFSDVKSNVFYHDLWNINKEFFEIANNRYKKTRLKIGLINDPVLEGQRMEAAFFAVALELLKPKANQINNNKNTNENLFDSQEVAEYDFTLPDYLTDDVQKEVSLITKANTEAKSPILLYDRVYSDFRVPSDNQGSSKLNNFYLATKWVNSAFPLYFKSDKCPDCLLDKNDWLISFVAANYIAKDFSENQDLKNRWAKIYKVLSYSSGLRKDLTYLHYHQVLDETYGDNYQIENIYSNSKGFENSLAEAVKVQQKIDKKYSFSSLEGWMDRGKDNGKNAGMRLLQDYYWPDDYIFSQLSNPLVSIYTKSDKNPYRNLNVTVCPSNRQEVRCSGIGLDVMNLILPISKNNYFNENSSYLNYTSQSNKVKQELAKFNVDNWHSNNYWTYIDVTRKAVLNSQGFQGPIYELSDSWKSKQINTALGGWVNLRLQQDKLALNWQTLDNLNAGNESRAYVEPNLDLVNELMANTKMISQMMVALRIVKDVDLISKKINEYYDELGKVKLIIKKELNGEDLDDNDNIALLNIINKYTVAEQAPKSARIDFGKGGRLKESIAGVKLLIGVYQLHNQKVLSVGPIFNYKEQKEQ